MGSWFSSPAAAGDLVSLIPRAHLGRAISISMEMLASLEQERNGGRRMWTIEELYAECIRWFANGVLKHYNANNPGAEFQFPADSATEMKAACTGFREGLIWYHLGFSARCRGDDNQQEMHLFFAELCYDIDSEKLNLETCTILEKPMRSSCAFCPEESKIMHPSEPEFVCGKDGQQAEFFRITRHMLLWPWEACTGDLDL
uniref:Uncharacterized protein n=3 Tax=Avena sativa TaxID=4498 RepID=A0ACD5UJP0_AVESA